MILPAVYLAIAAISVALGLQHSVLALRGVGRAQRSLFALGACALAADAVIESRMFAARSVDEFLRWMPWTALLIATSIVALSGYVALRTGLVRRWMLATVVVAAVVTPVLDFAVGIAFVDPVVLDRSMLPWGEPFSRVVGDPNPLRLVGDIAIVGFLAILLDVTVRLARRGDSRQARLLGGGLVVFALGLMTIIPSDLGWIAIPSLHPLAFLAIVFAMAWEVSDELARAARLSREVREGERRWRRLVDGIRMIVVGLDRDGRITSVNPFARSITGYGPEEMIGRHYLDFVPESDRGDVAATVERGLSGGRLAGQERALVTRDGRERIVAWRSITVPNSDGRVEELLSLGVDVTEKRASEADLRKTTEELARAVAELQALRRRLEDENVLLREQVETGGEHAGIVGNSDGLRYVLHKVEQVAATDATVLLQGETGVGKGLVARAIHDRSERADGPFVSVNCAALAPTLIESELLGHEKGSFTGADGERRGRFEMADGGTLVLDEIGELPIGLQAKLLGVLESGEFERVGGSTRRRADVRVIASTNRDLRREVDRGTFRRDLFYRLEVYPITIPPLRERTEDIPVLAAHFVRRASRLRGTRVDEIPAEVIRHLEGYDWPGNVRELQNVIERAVLLRPGDRVLRLASPLPGAAAGQASDPASNTARDEDGRIPTLEDVERRHIEEVLRLCGGQIAGAGGAATILGLNPSTLRSRMAKLGLQRSSRSTGPGPSPPPRTRHLVVISRVRDPRTPSHARRCATASTCDRKAS